MTKMDDNLFEDVEYNEDLFEDVDYTEDSDVRSIDDISTLESALRGAAQGVTFDFADEIAGAGEAAYKTALGSDKLAEIAENYRKYRDESRAEFKAAQEANPGTYITGEIVGGIAPAIATGGAALMARGGAALGKTALKKGAAEAAKRGGLSAGTKLGLTGAAYGGASGLGVTEADLTKGDVAGAAGDVGIGAGLGGLGAKIVPAVGSAVSAATPALKKLGTRALATLAEVNNDALEQIVKNPKAAREAVGDTRKYAVELKDSIVKNLKAADELADQGKKVLSDEKNIDPVTITNKIQEALSGDLGEAGQKQINEIISNLNKKAKTDTLSSKSFVSEKDVKEALSDFYSIIYPDGGSPLDSLATSKQRLSTTANEISDFLKKRNPEYEGFMDTSHSLYQKVKSASKVLGIDEKGAKFDQLFTPDAPRDLRNMDFLFGKEDTLVSKLNKSVSSDKKATTEGISNVAESMGIKGFAEKVKSEAARRDLDKDVVNPLIKQIATARNIGSAILGSMFGPLGFVVGGAASIAAKPAAKKALLNLDKLSSAASKIKAPVTKPMEIADSALNRVSSKLKTSNSEGARVLSNKIDEAMQAGGATKNALKFSLSQQPAFRQEVNKTDESLMEDLESLDEATGMDQLMPQSSSIDTVKESLDRYMKMKASGDETPEYETEAVIGAIDGLDISEQEKDNLKDQAIMADTFAEIEDLKNVLERYRSV